MEISDDEANMIAGRIFDAIEAKGIFNRQLVATEIKAGLALVKAPAKRTSDHEATLARSRQEYMTHFVREARERAIAPPAFVPENYYPRHPDYKPPTISDTERKIVKEIQELLGMPLSPGKRDPDGTAHYRLPDTRKAKTQKVFVHGLEYEIPAAMNAGEAIAEIPRWIDRCGCPPGWAKPVMF